VSGDRADGQRRASAADDFFASDDKPVAPYLIAIAVGDLAFQPLGPRTGVYAEPATHPAAAADLSTPRR
jgi:hypothetical protein